jgi:hypothetical protein
MLLELRPAARVRACWLVGAFTVALACGGGGDNRETTTLASTTAADDGGSSSGNADASVGESSTADDGGGTTTSDDTNATSTGAATTVGGESSTTGSGGDLDPPAGGSSGGSGGGASSGDLRMTDGGIQYRIIAPGDAGPLPLMIVYSGTEGGQTMTSNLLMVADFTGTGGFVFAVLDGVQYNGDGDAGASVLDDVRADYDIDNDQTYLLSESAGTTAGLELGLSLRQSYFAAYWANDVNASAAPMLDANALGFAPYGNAGPGGDFPDANAIVDAMDAAGYRTPEPSPYDGSGSGTHGDPNQFLAALQWFPGKTRQ